VETREDNRRADEKSDRGPAGELELKSRRAGPNGLRRRNQQAERERQPVNNDAHHLPVGTRACLVPGIACTSHVAERKSAVTRVNAAY
jgi:hypothetical protein